MGSFSGLGIGLSFVFGCILMGLVAELYYLLWWKKRITNTSSTREMVEFSFLFCWKRPNSSFNSTSSSQELTNPVRISQENEDLEMGNKDLGSNKSYGEGGVEAELMRMHNLCGPPRFLFTIKEESKEDLESEDGKSKGERSSRKGSRTKSLSDLVFAVDGNGTPFLTPLSSPISVRTPNSLDSYNNHGFNPLFESLSEAELNRLRSSPPPKFKFLKDAEDKLIKRLLIEEAEKKRVLILKNEDCEIKDSRNEEKEGSFVSFLNTTKSKSLASQVLPLASSPVIDKNHVHL